MYFKLECLSKMIRLLFPTEKTYETGNTHLGWYFHQHVDMIRTHFRLYYFHLFPIA